jgi:6-phosphogluconolactonase (cycloisomerase 2 family)
MRGRLQRCFSAYAICCALLLLIDCGDNSNSTNSGNNNTGTTSGSPTPGTSNPGNTGGTGSGGSGSGGGSIPAATYVYAGVATDAGGIRSFKVDTASGSLTELSGSPTSLPQGFTTGGSLVASQGFVYTVNRSADATSALMFTFKADAATGVLSPVGNPATVSANNDSDIRMMKLSADGKTAYLTTQFVVNSVGLNSGAPSLLNTQQLSSGDVWGFGVAGEFAFAGIQDGNPKTGFAQPVIKRMSVNANGSLGAAQTVVTLSDSNIPFDLTTDAAGKFVAATTDLNNDHVRVWAVNSMTGALTEVPGSPFSNDGEVGKLMRFDPSGTHLYLINNPDFEPRHEDVMVFTVGSNGTLTLVQTLDLGNEQQATSFKVESDFAYITNQASGIQGSITVLRRDSSSGQLSLANTTPVSSSLGSLDTLHF